jgi:hypothetical protein
MLSQLARRRLGPQRSAASAAATRGAGVGPVANMKFKLVLPNNRKRQGKNGRKKNTFLQAGEYDPCFRMKPEPRSPARKPVPHSSPRRPPGPPAIPSDFRESRDFRDSHEAPAKRRRSDPAAQCLATHSQLPLLPSSAAADSRCASVSQSPPRLGVSADRKAERAKALGNPQLPQLIWRPPRGSGIAWSRPAERLGWRE